jgi:RimJ/RimL family protein N-acetyltransferase
MNVAIIGWLAAKLGIERALPRSSTLQARGKRGGLVAQICAELGASDYVSPPGAADYLLQELPAFAERGIEVWFQHYEAQEYPQLYPPFQPNAAVLDLLFNVGGDALEVIRRGRRPARSVAEQREQISLRSVTAQDEEMVFAWRNLPEIIRCSTDQRGVTRSEHETWFRETLAGGRREMFIVLCGDLPVGTVRFDPEGVERCVLSIYLIPGYTGRGLGVQAIRMGCGLMAKRYRTVLALIRTDNAYALSAFAKAGFREVSGEELCPQGEIAMQMELG